MAKIEITRQSCLSWNYLYAKALFVALLMLVLSGCGQPDTWGHPKPWRYKVEQAERICHKRQTQTRDCYMEHLGRYVHREGVDEDGNQTLLWYMRVSKTRMKEIGEEVKGDNRIYRRYVEDCWFTATFAANGDLLGTQWDGPGCFGRGD